MRKLYLLRRVSGKLHERSTQRDGCAETEQQFVVDVKGQMVEKPHARRFFVLYITRPSRMLVHARSDDSSHSVQR